MNENPQKENGYTAIANEIVEALAFTKLTTQESRFLWAVFRKTYGYNKKEDWISLGQIAKYTGLSKAHASHTKARLLRRNIVAQTGNKIRFNKFYSQWRELPEQATDKKLPKQAIGVAYLGNGGLPKQAYTKVDVTKVDNTKETIFDENKLTDMEKKVYVKLLEFAEQEIFLDEAKTIYSSVRKADKLRMKHGNELYVEACVKARDKTDTTFRYVETVVKHIEQELLSLSKKRNASR